jgi:hypothetical protein
MLTNQLAALIDVIRSADVRLGLHFSADLLLRLLDVGVAIRIRHHRFLPAFELVALQQGGT